MSDPNWSTADPELLERVLALEDTTRRRKAEIACAHHFKAIGEIGYDGRSLLPWQGKLEDRP